MADKADDKTDDKSTDKKTDDKAADKAADKKTDDKAADKAADEKPAKVEKTFTKAELEQAKKAAFEEAKKKFEDEKDLSELERLKKENADLLAANQLRDAKDNVIDALTKAGARSPELLWKAMKSDLEFDDKGALKNLDALVTASKTDFADQFGEPKPDDKIGGGEGQGDKTKPSGLTAEKLATMSPQEIMELDQGEVNKVMAAG